MPSQTQTAIGKHDEIQVLKHKVPVKKSPVPYQAPRLSNVKVSSSGEKRSVNLQGKNQPMENTKPIEQASPDQCTAIAGKIGVGKSTPDICRKPWPSTKVTGGPPVVKCTAGVPSYLQQYDKGDLIEDKALQYRVIDWGRLEKWSYLQKQMAANRGAGDSLSNSSASSLPFSTSGSSAKSDRSIISPLNQKERSPTLVTHQDSSTKRRQTRMIGEHSSVPVMSLMTDPDLRSSVVKYVSLNKSPSPVIGRSSCAFKGADASFFSPNEVKTQICQSRAAENFQGCEQQNFQGKHLQLDENELSDQLSLVESMWDRLQESFHEGHMSYDFAMGNRGSAQVKRSSFSGVSAPIDIQFTNPPLRISYSSPLSTSQRHKSNIANDPLSEIEMFTADSKGTPVKLGKFTDDSFGTPVANMCSKSNQDEVKIASVPRRDLSPQRLLRAGLNRIKGLSLRESSLGQRTKAMINTDDFYNDSEASDGKCRRSSSPQCLLSAGLNLIRNSSSREGSSGKQRMKETVCSDNSHEDSADSNIRSRVSPLRRILDPLKPMNQIHFSGPVTSLPSHRVQGVTDRDKISIRDELTSANRLCKSSDFMVSHSRSPITVVGCAGLAGKQMTSSRQALLKLAWRNGFPLHVFTSSDINIFAATMEKRSSTQNDDLECTYTIFTVREVKKKAGVWMSQVNKNKKHDLVYNVVGKLKVSSSKSNSDDLVRREFVLYGGVQISAAKSCAGSPLFKSELAAIVIQVQNVKKENDNCEIMQNSSCKESSHLKSTDDEQSTGRLQDEAKTENASLASMVAILPSGVHGFAATGQPSPLIERWKSGSCDCGGWDEGCMLTVLSDKVQKRSPTCTKDGTYRIQLFTQGKTKESKHAFSINAYKEGVYTVDFGASIPSLQVFAMCIAILHGKMPATHIGLDYSVEAQSLEEQSITEGGSLASYVPDHPPLSPVGRA